jgi:hypothetical protein
MAPSVFVGGCVALPPCRAPKCVKVVDRSGAIMPVISEHDAAAVCSTLSGHSVEQSIGCLNQLADRVPPRTVVLVAISGGKRRELGLVDVDLGVQR